VDECRPLPPGAVRDQRHALRAGRRLGLRHGVRDSAQVLGPYDEVPESTQTLTET
jgi:hypothetical protein